MTLPTFHSNRNYEACTPPRDKPATTSRVGRHYRPPPMQRCNLQASPLCLRCSPAGSIWLFPPTIKTANVIESATIAVGPHGVTADPVKHIIQNPFDPLHGHTIARLCRTVGSARFRVRDLSARRINSLNLLRARANWAFTVPSGTPRIRAVSRVEKPSTSRN
jgi:hypothetical protein